MSTQAEKPTTANAAAPNAVSKEEKSSDVIYKYDAEHVETLRENHPWTTQPKFFKNCKVSALAAMKMLKHALLGVETGRKSQGGTSFEIMGLLVGKPEGESIIIMDTVPSSVIGAENGVDMDKVLGYMTACSDALENKRPERFVGWYHSHPFDVETYSHCSLSTIDVQTQTGWQNSVPIWVAIVVDPLRSLVKQEPELGAFRVYPVTHQLAHPDECPDGTQMPKESRMVRWGVSADRYYALKVSFFMSMLSRKVLDTMSKSSLWIRILASSSLNEADARQRFSDRVSRSTAKLNAAAASLGSEGGPGGGGGGRSMISHMGGGAGRRLPGKDDFTQATLACCELATEHCKGHASQIAKDLLFNRALMAQLGSKQAQQQQQSGSTDRKENKEKTTK